MYSHLFAFPLGYKHIQLIKFFCVKLPSIVICPSNLQVPIRKWQNSSNPSTVPKRSRKMSVPHLRTGQSSAKPPPFVAGLPEGGSVGHAGAPRPRRFEVCPRRGTGTQECRLALGATPQRCRRPLVSDIHNSRMSEAQRTFGATPVPAY